MNFGPSSPLNYSVSAVAKKIVAVLNPDLKIDSTKLNFKEKMFLSVDSSSAFQNLRWSAKLDIDEAILLTCEWYKGYLDGEDMTAITKSQLLRYANHNLGMTVNTKYA